MTEHLDLLGDPVRLNNGRRGRPAHLPTQENRNKVMMLLALGWSNERIANALRITPPSLRKHYFSELKSRSIQRDRLDAARVMQAWKAADSGNVGGMRLLDQMIAKNDAMLADARIRKAEKDEPAEPEGKKARAQREAEQAIRDGSWGADLDPGRYN